MTSSESSTTNMDNEHEILPSSTNINDNDIYPPITNNYPLSPNNNDDNNLLLNHNESISFSDIHYDEIYDDDPDDDPDDGINIPPPPIRQLDQISAREQLIERERQGRLERERARLKRQLALNRELEEQEEQQAAASVVNSTRNGLTFDSMYTNTSTSTTNIQSGITNTTNNDENNIESNNQLLIDGVARSSFIAINNFDDNKSVVCTVGDPSEGGHDDLLRPNTSHGATDIISQDGNTSPSSFGFTMERFLSDHRVHAAATTNTSGIDTTIAPTPNNNQGIQQQQQLLTDNQHANNIEVLQNDHHELESHRLLVSSLPESSVYNNGNPTDLNNINVMNSNNNDPNVEYNSNATSQSSRLHHFSEHADLGTSANNSDASSRVIIMGNPSDLLSSPERYRLDTNSQDESTVNDDNLSARGSDDDNNNIDDDDGIPPPIRLARLTEAEILEMNELDYASVGNMPPRSVRDEHLTDFHGNMSELGRLSNVFSEGTRTTLQDSDSDKTSVHDSFAGNNDNNEPNDHDDEPSQEQNSQSFSGNLPDTMIQSSPDTLHPLPELNVSSYAHSNASVLAHVSHDGSNSSQMPHDVDAPIEIVVGRNNDRVARELSISQHSQDDDDHSRDSLLAHRSNASDDRRSHHTPTDPVLGSPHATSPEFVSVEDVQSSLYQSQQSQQQRYSNNNNMLECPDIEYSEANMPPQFASNSISFFRDQTNVINTYQDAALEPAMGLRESVRNQYFKKEGKKSSNKHRRSQTSPAVPTFVDDFDFCKYGSLIPNQSENLTSTKWNKPANEQIRHITFNENANPITNSMRSAFMPYTHMGRDPENMQNYDLTGETDLLIPLTPNDKRHSLLMSLNSVVSEVFSSMRSLSDDEIEANTHDAEKYSSSNAFSRAFPERLIALIVTLIIEIPVLLMISGGSSQLCQLIGRRRYQLLVSFLPLSSAISGNCGLQASTLATRAISHLHVTRDNYLKWLRCEMQVATILGINMGAILGLVAYYASDFDVAFGLTIGLANFFSIITAGLTGTIAPLLFTFIFHRDSGKWGGPLETAIQDIVGSFAMVILSYRLLLLFGDRVVDPNDMCGDMD